MQTSRARTPSHSVDNVGSVMTAAATERARKWSSSVNAHTLTLEHATVENNTDHVLYHMKLNLETALPAFSLAHDQYLCLSWPYGGLWRIEEICPDRTNVSCFSVRKTDLKHGRIESHARAVAALATKVKGDNSPAVEKVANADALLYRMDEKNMSFSSSSSTTDTKPEQGQGNMCSIPTLFEWKMLHGYWGTDVHHWFIHDINMDSPKCDSSPNTRLLQVQLFVDFAPLQAQIEVNAVMAIDTVAQTYAADVTWQVTLPAITTFRDDAVLLEFLDIMEIDNKQFEFSNVAEMKECRELSSSVTPAGFVQFNKPVSTGGEPPSCVEPVYHFQFSRRVTAVFTKEMALHTFPFDQQKLSFELTTGICGMPAGALELIPAPDEPGSFSVENFQLGNVFDVAYHNKIFVSEIKQTGPRKTIEFELVLERKSAYYLTNVALISAVITYLSFFVSWAPGDKDGNLMETGTRLQNVTAMVLTAVTFKNQVAALVPKISYFTILDNYVFMCFMVTSAVTVENAIYPLVQRIYGDLWGETNLLGYALVLFTVVNLIWAAYIRRWIIRRRRAAQVLMQVGEYIKVIAEESIPAWDRKQVLLQFLAKQKIETWCEPQFLITSNGDIHLQAPGDIPEDGNPYTHCIVRRARSRTNAKKFNGHKLSQKHQQTAEKARKDFRKIYANMTPSMGRYYELEGQCAEHCSVRVDRSDHSGAVTTTRQMDHTRPIPAAKTTEVAYQAGGARRLLHRTSAGSGSGQASIRILQR